VAAETGKTVATPHIPKARVIIMIIIFMVPAPVGYAADITHATAQRTRRNSNSEKICNLTKPVPDTVVEPFEVRCVVAFVA
jgi:hypothetical protein